jgi:hypothetical protein
MTLAGIEIRYFLAGAVAVLAVFMFIRAVVIEESSK